jgi:amino acid transporter
MKLWPLVAAVFFLVSGGPFGVEDTVSKSGYWGAIVILLVTPLIWSFPTALMVSELASTLPEEGGYYVWVRRAMGPFWGYQEAWLSLVGSIFDMALYPTLFVGYLGHFAPGVTAGWRGIGIGVALTAAAAAWNLRGAVTVGDSSVWMGALLLVPFFVLMGYGFLHPAASKAAPIPLRNVDMLGGILVSMWNYMGWDNASTVAGEVERPQRTYPLAMAIAVVLVGLTYVLPIAGVAATGLDANRWTTGGWADVARAVIHNGTTANVIAIGLTIGGMLGAIGALNAYTLVLSRLPAVMADDHLLPRVLSRRLANGVPWVAVLACATMWALCLGLSFTKLIVLDVLMTGLSILLEFAALVALRIRAPKLPRPYRVPGGLAGAIGIGIPPLALLVITAIRSDVEPIGPFNALQLGGLLIVLGVVAYFLGKRYCQGPVTQ